MKKKFSIINIFSLLLWSALISTLSCIDPYEIELEAGQVFLVVDGTFTPENKAHELNLYRTVSQIARQRTPVLGAEITLIDEMGKRGQYVELREGKYVLPPDIITGETNKEFFVEIKLRTGEEYRSRPAIMPRIVQADSAYIQYNEVEEALITGRVIQQPVLEVFIDSPLPSDGRDYWLKWEVTTLYSFPEILCGPIPPPAKTCFVPGNAEPQRVNLLNGEQIKIDRLDRFKVNEKQLALSDFEFRGKHYFIVNQQSISKETYDYWDKVNRLTNQTGSIFDAIPAGIPGNIYNVNDPEEVILGYFELSNPDVKRQFISANQLAPFYKFTNNVCPTFLVPFSSFVPACCNCQRIENSTLIRPSWF